MDYKVILNSKSKTRWISELHSKIFKILPIYENENTESYHKYVNRLLIRLTKFNSICDGIFNDIVLDLSYISENDVEHEEIRKIILDDVKLAVEIYKNITGEDIDE